MADSRVAVRLCLYSVFAGRSRESLNVSILVYIWKERFSGRKFYRRKVQAQGRGKTLLIP